MPSYSACTSVMSSSFIITYRHKKTRQGGHGMAIASRDNRQSLCWVEYRALTFTPSMGFSWRSFISLASFVTAWAVSLVAMAAIDYCKGEVGTRSSASKYLLLAVSSRGSI
jgi:hypothetical protein